MKRPQRRLRAGHETQAKKMRPLKRDILFIGFHWSGMKIVNQAAVEVNRDALRHARHHA
jgi:hypothetical protein